MELGYHQLFMFISDVLLSDVQSHHSSVCFPLSKNLVAHCP